MRLPKYILNRFNQKDTLLVISNYPKKGELYSNVDGGVASYTKNTLLGIQKTNPTAKIVVFAPTLSQNDAYSYTEDKGVLVIRCFRRDVGSSFVQLLEEVRLFNQTKSLLFAFEFALYGDLLTTLTVPFFLSALALLGKQITLVLHQVVLELNTLSGHIGVYGLKNRFMSLILRRYYNLLCAPVQKIIVLEDQIKERLSKVVNAQKIEVTYHGVDAINIKKEITQKKARVKLGIKNNELVLLYYGYITWYKGADILAKIFCKNVKIGNKKVRVILAGGPSATQQHKKHYKEFFNRVKSLAQNGNQVTITGFVNEEDVSTYMSAADLVIFPYRTFMSSSGALATAFAFEKPFLVSSKLRGYFASKDIKDLLVESDLTFNDISFDLQKKSLLQSVERVITKGMTKKLSKLSRAIKIERDFTLMAKHYSDSSSDKSFTFLPARLQLSYGKK